MEQPVTSSFRFEREMMEPATQGLAPALRLATEAITILKTPSIGNIIPDILIGEWQVGAICTRWKVTHGEASLLAELERNRELHLTTLGKILFLSEESVNRYVKRLERIKAISITPHGTITIVDGSRTDQCEIVAVEVKMRRWREALQQAINYQTFADQSYVVLDASQISLNEDIFSAFERANVGLFLQSETSLKRIIRCTSKRRYSQDRVIAYQKLNHSWSTLSKGSRNSSTSDKPIAISADAEHQYV